MSEWSLKPALQSNTTILLWMRKRRLRDIKYLAFSETESQCPLSCFHAILFSLTPTSTSHPLHLPQYALINPISTDSSSASLLPGSPVLLGLCSPGKHATPLHTGRAHSTQSLTPKLDRATISVYLPAPMAPTCTIIPPDQQHALSLH